MTGKNKFVLELSKIEADIISQFYDEMLNCSIQLNDIGVMNVIRAIYNNEKVVDEIEDDKFIISYEEEEE